MSYLFLGITAHSSPIKDKSLELSKSSIARSKLLNILNNSNIHRHDNLRRPSERDRLNDKSEIRELNRVDLDDSKKKANYKDVRLAFNEEATELLKTLISALETVNENLSTQNKKLKQTKTKELYVVKVNENQRYARHKRDANDIKDIEVKNTTAPENVSVTIEEDKVTTEAKTAANVNTTNVNKTEINPEEPNCNQTLNGRRKFNPYDIDTDVSKAVKTRILSYINEYFNDIAAKTNSLKEIKRTYAASDEYSIGYIIANIDTLGINLHNLRLDIEANHQGWSEKQILDMFDKIKMSHKVVSSLLDALKTIIDKPLVKESKRTQYLHLV